jgi:hypothetical protein
VVRSSLEKSQQQQRQIASNNGNSNDSNDKRTVAATIKQATLNTKEDIRPRHRAMSLHYGIVYTEVVLGVGISILLRRHNDLTSNSTTRIWYYF